jgi:hypothetical protein
VDVIVCQDVRMTDPGGAPMSDAERDPGAAPGLAPSTLLARADQRATQVVVGVLVVGIVLVVLGGVAGARLAPGSPARGWVVAAVCAALLALAAALAALVVRLPGRAVPADPDGLGRWYAGQLRRASAAAVAGLLAVLAVLLSGAAAVAALSGGTGGTAGGRTAEPVFTVQLTGSGEEGALTARVEFPGTAPGDVLVAEVVGVQEDNTKVLLARSVSRGDGGTLTAELAAPTGNYRNVMVTAVVGSRRCTAQLPTYEELRPMVSCTSS